MGRDTGTPRRLTICTLPAMGREWTPGALRRRAREEGTPEQRAIAEDWIAYRIRWNLMWMRRQLAAIVLIGAAWGMAALVVGLVNSDSSPLGVLFGGAATLGGGFAVASFVVRANRLKWWLTGAGLALTVLAFALLFLID
jgi:hypothetical protein